MRRPNFESHPYGDSAGVPADHHRADSGSREPRRDRDLHRAVRVSDSDKHAQTDLHLYARADVYRHVNPRSQTSRDFDYLAGTDV